MHLLAYNLLRTLMWPSVASTQVTPLRLSLQRTRQQFNHFRPQLAMASNHQRRQFYTTLLNVISTLLVPLRPNRVELMAFEDGIHLNQEVQRWFHWYNRERPHQALKYRTPEAVYWETRSRFEKET